MEQGNPFDIPKSAIVIIHTGAIGGAPKRIFNLFCYLNQTFPGKFYLFLNQHLFTQFENLYESLPVNRIKIIDIPEDRSSGNSALPSSNPRYFDGNIPDPIIVDQEYGFARKVYWYYKNKHRQHIIFKQIEKVREALGVKVFYGVFAGALPLVFYLKNGKRKAAVIFNDMDSWFSDVFENLPGSKAGIKQLWYRKYYSYNYALENSDIVDFLSPYIYEGVKKRGINIRQSSASISPCSFIDYTGCVIGDKSRFEIAFSSRLEPSKNPMLYLEAAKDILKKYPDIRFYILGEGSLVNEIRNFIDSNNLSGSIIFQFHKNPPEIFKNTSVFVSLQDGTNYPSQSVLEAMACSNAIIASDRGDTKLFINCDNGLLIDIDKDQLVSALEKLILNPVLARTMGVSGREFALKNHTIERFSEYFLELVRKAGTYKH